MHTTSKTVLISGAGIAGQALAFWLSREGFSTTLVEQASGTRLGGQAVDIRGKAIDIVDRMGLHDVIYDLRTRMRGMSILDATGKEVERFDTRTFSGGRLDSGDVEIFRDDLAGVLHEATREHVEYIFDDEIDSIQNGDHSIKVTFVSGERRNFDLLVGADGFRSKVRLLTFGEEAQFVRHLGGHLAIFSTPNVLGLEDWQLTFGTDRGGYLIYPTRDNAELRVFLGTATNDLNEGRSGANGQRGWIADRCAWMGGPVSALIDYVEATTDLYFGPIAQIQMSGWSKGRTVLLGDAAYCASPKSGQGTSLALVGAYVLASELAAADNDYSAGFLGYERRLRQFVELNQALATENPHGPPSDALVDRAKNAVRLDF